MSRGSQFTAVVFDLGNVLVGWDPYQPFAGRMTRDEWEQSAAEAGFPALNAMADRGVPLSEITRTAAEADARHGELMDFYFQGFEHSLTGPVPGTAEIVRDVRDAGLRVLGLTNWSGETFHLAPEYAPVIGDLEAVVVSGREGVCKPSHEIFELIADRHDLTPARTVFVDDSPPNVAAAADLGFTAVRFVDAARLRAELREMGILL